MANKYIRICKKYCHFITFFHLYFLLFLHFHPHVLPEEPFQGKRWETLYLGRKERPPLPFLCEGKDSNGFPHIFTLMIFSEFLSTWVFENVSTFAYFSSLWIVCSIITNNRKIERPFCWFWFCCSSARIDSQDWEVRNWPMIQKERIEAKNDPERENWGKKQKEKSWRPTRDRWKNLLGLHQFDFQQNFFLYCFLPL